MNFWSSVSGMMEAELISAAPEAAFAAISNLGIELRNFQQVGELRYIFLIKRKDCKTLQELCKKRGETLKIQKKQGLYWTGKALFGRGLLLTGGIALMTLVLWLPSRVFFVSVDGNEAIPDRKILEAAEDCGIAFGASRRMVRSEKVKNALLSAVPELQWAGVNTSGCTAVISVRERSDLDEKEVDTGVASIEAARDGYILSCTVTRGNGLVKPGTAVKEGQTLISAYTDCGLCIRAERAEGEILAQTSRSLEAVSLSQCVKKGEQKEVKRKVSLLLRKKRIILWKDSGIWDASCGRMYEEYYVTLPGGFQIPLALCVEEYFSYETLPSDIPEWEAEAALKEFADKYLSQHMVAGKIISSLQTVTPENGGYRLTGEYACIEMIGKVRQEQIGDTNGKDS